MAGVHEFEIFSTCPQSKDFNKGRYLSHVIEVAKWSELAGCRGMLIYTDNGILDPWLVAQVVIENTESLSPLVAVQPLYMHPYAVAKMVSSLGFLYKRKLFLNMVAGGFKNDLLQLNDTLPHDRRYSRLHEYTTIVKNLLTSRQPYTFDGEFYQVKNLTLHPALPPVLFPGIFLSGSSEAGMRVAEALGATPIQYPKPVEEYVESALSNSKGAGIRIGIIAREDESSAWAVAHSRFPEDRRGQLTHQLAMKISDSEWHKQLSELGAHSSNRSPYWLGPFQNYRSFCPYLVGSYTVVAAEVRKYLDLGYSTFILDIPPNREELEHIGLVFDTASKGLAP